MTDLNIKWRYNVADINLSQLEERLNDYGDQRWEVVVVDFDWDIATARVVLKKPMV